MEGRDLQLTFVLFAALALMQRECLQESEEHSFPGKAEGESARCVLLSSRIIVTGIRRPAFCKTFFPNNIISKD